MSVWKKISRDVLSEDVNRKLLAEALEDMGIKLNSSIKQLKNGYGSDTCDAAFIKNGRLLSLGIRYTAKGGIELVGDIWGTGLGKDGTQESLMNLIAHNYQVKHIKDQLEYTSWNIEEETTIDGKTVLELVQY